MVFPVFIYGREKWTIKKAEHPRTVCFWTVVLEKTLESPLNYKEIQPVHPKGNQFWMFIGRTDAEAEAPALCPPDAKNWLLGKDPDAGKELRQEEKGMTEDEWWMASPTRWTWIWGSFGNLWWTGRPGVLQSMRSPRVGHHWVTELDWIISCVEVISQNSTENYTVPVSYILQEVISCKL